ncbi:MAG: HD domain-containing protein [Spirochaetales bacterium]|nr:HD domain-containing protein [Spirochaetales bacterium]
MFERKLSEKEVDLINKIIQFIEEKHSGSEGHDYSHVLEVARYSIQIAERISEKVDPFILITGALFHDIGRVDAPSGRLHGLLGGSIAEGFLKTTWVEPDAIKKICSIVVRHTPTSMLPPLSTEEKIVFDADALDRLGLMGMLRGIMGKAGSIKEILEDRLEKRKQDFSKLHFKESEELGRALYKETLMLIKLIDNSLARRIRNIEELKLPV